MEDDAFELAVEAEGDSPLQYQWLRASVPLRQHTQSRLRIRQAALTDAASYACQVCTRALMWHINGVQAIVGQSAWCCKSIHRSCWDSELVPTVYGLCIHRSGTSRAA